MYKLIEKNNKKYIAFKTVINNEKPYKTRDVVRRLYGCKKTALHSAQYIILNGRKFWIDDNAIIKADFIQGDEIKNIFNDENGVILDVLPFMDSIQYYYKILYSSGTIKIEPRENIY